MVLGAGSARAETPLAFEGGLGIGGIRIGGTSLALGVGAGVRVRPDLVVGARVFAMRSGAIEFAYRPESVTAGFAGPSLTLLGTTGFVGAALGASVFDTDRERDYRVALALRTGVLAELDGHVIAFSFEAITPLQGTPPWIAVVVGYQTP